MLDCMHSGFCHTSQLLLAYTYNTCCSLIIIYWAHSCQKIFFNFARINSYLGGKVETGSENFPVLLKIHENHNSFLKHNFMIYVQLVSLIHTTDAKMHRFGS